MIPRTSEWSSDTRTILHITSRACSIVLHLNTMWFASELMRPPHIIYTDFSYALMGVDETRAITVSVWVKNISVSCMLFDCLGIHPIAPRQQCVRLDFNIMVDGAYTQTPFYM